MTTRERWKALHRARREFRRLNDEMAGKYAQLLSECGADDPRREHAYRGLYRCSFPPIVIDPGLPRLV